jgi:hypothetical protein
MVREVPSSYDGKGATPLTVIEPVPPIIAQLNLYSAIGQKYKKK